MADSVTVHEAWGLGSYCVFTADPSIVAERAFEAPDSPGVRFHNMVTVSLGQGHDHPRHQQHRRIAPVPTVKPVNIVSYP